MLSCCYSIFILERTVIQIPVQHIKSNTPSNNQNLFISEHERDTTSTCLLCDHLFHDPKYKRICPRCDDRIKYSTSGGAVSSRPQSTNLYLPRYNSSNSTTVLSPVPKTTVSRRVTCRNCGSPNILNNWSSSSDQFCSACRRSMSPVYNY